MKEKAIAMALLGLLGLVATAEEGCAQTASLAQDAVRARLQSRRLGLPERIGGWRLVRFVSGEHAHFLFTSGQRALSLFVTPAPARETSHPRSGWRATSLGAGRVGYLHQDARLAERNALAWRRGTRRWMILGRLSPQELCALAVQIERETPRR